MARARRGLTVAGVARILNRMVEYSPTLDRAFAALADPHRRQILERLGSGPAAASELAEPLAMTLTGVLKHVRFLEDARLVTTDKVGRVRWCRLAPPGSLDEVAQWVNERRQRWEQRLDRFEQHIAQTEGQSP
jgi:DNA-binding transcriptional ArsR family regulator